ncbi:extracellular solute-binding protein [Dactylosporangium aurantiacum]|uniref:Extracellular solute-binding protein n=1 Tax=Dactylosporangium aurantiacum TaxID=35754 RepID=A0A9Q9MLA3_9ACTN|nr:extracellular solute-binding protein [Dactylosporangium aurantiacum]MDG6107656.1 extracellular solute-binding protein [Dactylosporangium aurantiacum]UWZ58750.1 extracellular solute-binding protein [Dactylosporangium aurantiacum]
MNGLSRRGFLRATALAGGGLLAAPLLSACSDDGGDAVQSGAVKIDFWTHDPGYEKTFTQTAKELTDGAAGSKFDYTLNVTKGESDALVTRLISQGAAGSGTPDLIGIVISVFPRLMAGGIAKQLLVPLDDLIAPVKDDLLRTAPYAYDGKVYALESDTCVSVLYYREDEFTKNGIPADVATWEDLATIGASLHARTGQSLGVVATGDNGSITNQYLQFLLQRGGGFFNDKGELLLDSPEAVQTIEFMAKGLQSGFLLGVPDPYGAPNTAALKEGKLIAIAMPNWYNVYGLQANVPDQKGKWKMRALPKFQAGGHIGSSLGGTGFAVVKNKPSTTAATELLRYTYLTREGQLARFKAGGFLPTLKSLYTDQDFLGYEDPYLGQKAFDVYTPAAKDLPTFYQNENLNLLTDTFGGPLLEALRGKKSPGDAIKETVEAYKKKAK